MKGSAPFYLFGTIGLLLPFLEQDYLVAITTICFLSHYLYLSSHRFKFSYIHPFQIYSAVAIIATFSNLQQEWKVINGLSLGGYVYAIPKYFFTASLVWFWGNFFFFWGFESLPKIKFNPIFYNLKRKRQFTFVFLIAFSIIFSSRFYYIPLPGAIGSFFYLIPIFVIFFFARIGYLFNNNQIINYGYFLMIFHTVLGVLYGFLRFEFIISGLVFVIGAYLGSQKLRIFLSFRYLPLFIFGILFILIFDYFGNNRGQMSYGLDRISELRTGAFEEETTLSENSFTPIDRMSVIAQLSNVVDLTARKEKNYTEETMLPIMTAFIPRFLWPEKPKIALGVWFAVEIGQAIRTENWYNTSINMTIPGHLFLAFGWTGVIIGSILSGFILKFIWLSADFKNPNNLLGGMLGGYLFYIAIQGFGADLQFLVTLIAIFLLFLLADFLTPKNENTLHRPIVAR